MNDFKANDEVVCVDASGQDKIYKNTAYHVATVLGNFVYLKKIPGRFLAKRFVKYRPICVGPTEEEKELNKQQHQLDVRWSMVHLERSLKAPSSAIRNKHLELAQKSLTAAMNNPHLVTPEN